MPHCSVPRSTVLSIVHIGFCIPQDASLCDAFSLWIKLLTLPTNGFNGDVLTILDQAIDGSFHQVHSTLTCGLVMFCSPWTREFMSGIRHGGLVHNFHPSDIALPSSFLPVPCCSAGLRFAS